MTSYKDIKLIALDLDDTTLRSDASLAPETEAAIGAAVAHKIEVCIASGRSFKALPKEVLKIDGIRYAVSSNGAAIEDMETGERISGFTIDESAVDTILALFEGEMLECFIDGEAFCDAEYLRDPVKYGSSPAYVGYVQTTRAPIIDMPRFMRENAHRLDSVDVLCKGPEHKEEIYEKALTIDGVYVTSSSPRLVEISDRNAGKGAALRRLSELLGIDRAHIAAFGNGDNDADMLRFAGLGIAVENATAACKEAADVICAHNNDHGVAIEIKKMLASD